MTILQMRYYYEVCRWQNITKAADILHIAQPTLSIAMRSLEEETGLNLFRHVGRNIQMTEDGALLFEKVRQILENIDRFEDAIKEMAQRRNHVQLAIPPQIGTIMLPLLLGEFRQKHPEIQLEILEPGGLEAAELVRNEEVDLAIIHYEDEIEGLVYRRLLAWPICLCVWPGHPLAARKSISLEEAARDPLVLLGRNFFMTRILLNSFEKQAITPEIIHFSPHLSTIWNLVQQKTATAIITENAMPPESRLCAIPIEGFFLRGCIISKKGRQIYSDEKCLIDFIRQKFAFLEEELIL